MANKPRRHVKVRPGAGMGYVLIDETQASDVVDIRAIGGGLEVEYLLTLDQYKAAAGAAVAWYAPDGQSVSPLGRVPTIKLTGAIIHVCQTIYLNIAADKHPWRRDHKPATRTP